MNTTCNTYYQATQCDNCFQRWKRLQRITLRANPGDKIPMTDASNTTGSITPTTDSSASDGFKAPGRIDAGDSSGSSANMPNSIKALYHEIYGERLTLVERRYGNRWMAETEVDA